MIDVIAQVVLKTPGGKPGPGDELRIELMYPLDDDADRFFRAHGQARLLVAI